MMSALGAFLGVLVGYAGIVVYGEIKLYYRKRYLRGLIDRALREPAPEQRYGTVQIIRGPRGIQ